MNESVLPAEKPRTKSGRMWVIVGVVLALLVPGLFLLQIQASILGQPWYAPLMATIGLVLCVVSLRQSRSIWRWSALVVTGLITGLAWFVVVGSLLPAYSGPVKEGQSFPDFSSQKADGTAFTKRELKAERGTVLVFFRGHW